MQCMQYISERKTDLLVFDFIFQKSLPPSSEKSFSIWHGAVYYNTVTIRNYKFALIQTSFYDT